MATSCQASETPEIDFIKPSSFNPSHVFVLGVAGGSGSGKTYFAQRLLSELGPDRCAILLQDNFYIDQSDKFDRDGGSVNFDHPSSIEFSLLAQCLAGLRRGLSVSVPSYDFVTHKRQNSETLLIPKPLIVVDGILIAHSEEVRKQCDRIVFFDTPESLRFQRRLDRDVKERGRTAEGVRVQFNAQVKPMHDLFVEPSQKHVDFVVRTEQDFELEMNRVLTQFSA